jgi:DNA-binding transcriptional LysR family regulator
LSMRDLDNVPLALPTVATNIRRQVNAKSAKEGVSLRTNLEIDDTPARLTFVEAGNAATLAPRSAFDDRSNLRTIPIAGAQFTLSAGLLTQRGVNLSSAAQRLADMIRTRFRQ